MVMMKHWWSIVSAIVVMEALLAPSVAAADSLYDDKTEEDEHSPFLRATRSLQSGKHAQYGFAHRVNDENHIASALGKGIAGIECDIIWSRSRNAWVVQHDRPNLSHAGPLLSVWLARLDTLLRQSRQASSEFLALWLDIKSPNDDSLINVMNMVHETFGVLGGGGSPFAVIYDVGSKDNVLGSDTRGYDSIKASLGPNEGIGIWLEADVFADEAYYVPDLIDKFEQDGITRTTVSHGHAFDISEDSLQTINLLNDLNHPYCFKKVFTWTNSLQSSMEDYTNPAHSYRTDGQIIGSPLGEWLPIYAPDDIPDFIRAVQKYSSSQRLATNLDWFWDVPEHPFSYQVILRTGDETNAGTDSNIFLTLYGENGAKTEEVRLNGLIDGNAFERGDVDVVFVFAVDVGKLSRIEVRSDGRYPGSDWYLNSISIGNDYANFDRWITGGTYDAPVVGPPRNYRVEVKTGDKWGAGTDSNIFVTIVGNKAQTKETRLNGLLSGNAFERNDLDVLTLVGLPDVGDKLLSIKVRHDGRYGGADWYLSWVKVNGKQATFNRWVDDQTVTANFPGTTCFLWFFCV